MQCITILASCCLLFSAAAHKLPDFVKKCSIKDPELNACILKSGKETVPHMMNGSKKYHIPVLDPLTVKEVRAAHAGLDMAGLDIVVEGARNLTLKDARIDLDKKNVTVEIVVPEVHFSGKYEVKGKLMSMPIVGHGNVEATLYDVWAKYTTTYDLQKLEDGQVYMMPKNYTVEFEPRNFKIRLDNLFNGNKLLGDNVNTFLNENWRAVLKEIGEPMYETLGMVAHKMIKDATRTVPYKDVFNDIE